MEKRTLNLMLYFLLLIILSYSVLGAHTAGVLVGPTDVYETNKATFYLFVGNNPGSNAIVNVSLSHPGYGSIEVLDLSPWLYDGDINWYNGLISQFGSQTFVFNATAQLVDANTTFSWDVTTADNNGGVQVNTVNVVVLNDSNPPSILNIYPEDYSFVRNDTIYFTIFVQELETSIPGGFNLGFDDNNPMQTSGAVKDNIVMANSGGDVFTGSLDPNDPSKVVLGSGSKYLDYRITGLSDAAGNNYDEGSNFPHHIYIDIEYPIVALNQPVNNYLTNQYLHNITFNMSDNSFETIGQGLFSPEVNCTANVQGVEYGPYSYNNNVNDAFIGINLTGRPDDYYSFFVYCMDKAGYFSMSEFRTLRMDTTGPQIILNSPANGSVITNGTLITLSVVDSIAGIDYVWYNNGTADFTAFDGNGEGAAGVVINTFDWEAGENNIIFYANDTLNNQADPLSLTFFVDKNPPVVDLVSPANGSLTNENVDFVFNATDDYDNILDCQLWVDGSGVLALPAVSGQDTIFNYNAPDGLHSWYVVCWDDYNPPVVSSSINNVNVDATPPSPPSLVPFDNLNGTNDDDGFIDISFNVTDENGLSGCVLSLNGVNQTNSTADFSINLVMSNDPYAISIGCNDVVDNWYYFPSLILYYDKIAPDVLNVNSSGITTSNAIISWNTNENANRNVTYWTDLNSTVSSSVNVFELNHSMPLSGLASSTAYSYIVSSSDMWGNVNTTTGFTFTTLNEPASPGSPGGGGGGSGGGKCNENWTCGEWSGCINQDGAGVQTRVCADSNDCDREEYKPLESQGCVLSFEDDDVEAYDVIEEEEADFTPTGGAVAGILESTPFKAFVALLIIVLLVLGFMRLMKERPPKRINVEDHLNDEDTPFSME